MSDTCDTVTLECVDCGYPREIANDREAILRTRGICGICYIARAIADYQAWCGAMGCDHDVESADEYLHVTDYGSRLPEWIAARVKEWASKDGCTCTGLYGDGIGRCLKHCKP